MFSSDRIRIHEAGTRLVTILMQIVVCSRGGKFSDPETHHHGDLASAAASTPHHPSHSPDTHNAPWSLATVPPVAVSYVTGQCTFSGQCNRTLGQSCYWLYDGCRTGQCMCDPKRHRMEPSGQCTPLKYGDEHCDSNDVCPQGMSCISGQCKCLAGKMTSDGQYCLRAGERLLTQTCWEPTTSCLHKSPTGYSKYDVRCSMRGECECSEGYKAEGKTCRRWNIKEFGCVLTYHCEGGAICDQGQCLCPHGYVAVAGNSKCAKRGAITDLPSGAICDEIHERRYCARGLVCHKCPDEEIFKCVSFLMASEYAFLWAKSSSTSCLPAMCIPLAVFLIALGHARVYYLWALRRKYKPNKRNISTKSSKAESEKMRHVSCQS